MIVMYHVYLKKIHRARWFPQNITHKLNKIQRSSFGSRISVYFTSNLHFSWVIPVCSERSVPWNILLLHIFRNDIAKSCQFFEVVSYNVHELYVAKPSKSIDSPAHMSVGEFVIFSRATFIKAILPFLKD